jgi:hypothetical protein
MAASVVSSGSGQPTAQRAGGGRKRSVTAPGLAWEFLRRNPSYCADYAAWRRDRRDPAAPIDRRWGLRFAADPRLPADEAQVFWLPEIAPGVVLRLEPRRADVATGVGRGLPTGAFVRAEDGLHVRTDWGLQVLVHGDDQGGGQLIVALVFDDHLRLRVRAVDALERLTAGRPPPKSHLTGAQIQRLDRCLAALDGDLAGERYRDIAARIYGGAAVAREPWKTASVRGATIRLVQAGRALMNGGYLKLLRGGL